MLDSIPPLAVVLHTVIGLVHYTCGWHTVLFPPAMKHNQIVLLDRDLHHLMHQILWTRPWKHYRFLQNRGFMERFSELAIFFQADNLALCHRSVSVCYMTFSALHTWFVVYAHVSRICALYLKRSSHSPSCWALYSVFFRSKDLFIHLKHCASVERSKILVFGLPHNHRNIFDFKALCCKSVCEIVRSLPESGECLSPPSYFHHVCLRKTDQRSITKFTLTCTFLGTGLPLVDIRFRDTVQQVYHLKYFPRKIVLCNWQTSLERD